MIHALKMSLVIAASAFGASAVSAQTLPTHRIPAALATEAASEAVASCAKGGYTETVVVVDADGATIAAVRGDGAGIHTLDSAHDKAYTSVTFKNDTMVLADRARCDDQRHFECVIHGVSPSMIGLMRLRQSSSMLYPIRNLRIGARRLAASIR